MFDVLSTRKQEDIFAYFSHFKDKTSVKYIVIDMNRAYLEVVKTYFPKAKIIIDKFHVSRYGTWALRMCETDAEKSFRL